MNNLVNNHFKNLEKLEQFKNESDANNDKIKDDDIDLIGLKKIPQNKIKVIYKKNYVFYVFNFITNKILEIIKFIYCLILTIVIYNYVYNCKMEFLKIYNDLNKNHFLTN